ncbi:MAG TPA: diaminopimelate epimerase [Candidatus Macondimonas sp.]|nr:diaminopimelate epimerase [Candidatus Macondimonas sp.]
MGWRFSKMHGLGNDFVVIDGVRQSIDLSVAQIRALADRHRGIGFDQLLLVEGAQDSAADFRYRIFNADGGEVAQCGNGARCFARFVLQQGLTNKRAISVETRAGLLCLYLEADGQVRVNMGIPRLDPADIPLRAPQQALRYTLGSAPSWQVGAVSLGNPHAVLAVPDVAAAPVAAWGPAIQALADFPEGVNVGFMETVARDHIRLRVYERGSGETLACGSGACAAVVVGRLWETLAPEVAVDLPGGRLRIQWAGPGEPVWMTGPALHVFDGQVPDLSG